ncbi:MAG: shikimate kinase [Lachnospiraceae bacterium]|nr:shikimate kinase [Lachnospiraceae bacterium]
MKNHHNNIVLIGFMGSGKTSVGTKLARAFSYQFLDTDALIEQHARKSIAQIFEEDGEEAFRQMEVEELRKLKHNCKDAIISTGGGMPMREEARMLLREMGTVILLRASKEVTLERLAGDTTRPLLSGDEMEQKIGSLLEKRMPYYEEAAHAVIDTDGKSFYEIINEVEKIMKHA